MNEIDRTKLKKSLEEIFPSDSIFFGDTNKLRVKVILSLIYDNGGRWKDID